MNKTVASVLKSRHFSTIDGYFSYKRLLKTVHAVYSEGGLLNHDYNLVLNLEYKMYRQLFSLNGKIGSHEGLDFLMLEAVNQKFLYPIFCVQKQLCESLYNTKPFILDEKDGVKQVPRFNSFVDRGVVLMPTDINGQKPKSSAFIFRKIEDQVIYVSCLGWDIGQRGCETIALPEINMSNLITNPYKDRNYYDDNGIGFLINLLLYKDSVKDKSNIDYCEQKQSNNDVTRKKNKLILSPRIIGLDHKVKKATNNQITNDQCRNSPQTHWRSGHWRWQPFGSKEQPKYKTIWIEPTLINA